MDYNELILNGGTLVKSKIDGDFEGFNDNKLFPLNNGQYWIQKNYKYWYYYSYMASVTIYRYHNINFLTIDGQNQFVEVELLANVIKATIVNDFYGWSGDTLFELDNGQIWKQCEYNYDYNYLYRPNAIIYSIGYGFKIFVKGKSVGVTRIK